MKKIYLIDDNVDGNRQKYGSGFVDDGLYQDVMVVIDKLSPDNDISFLENASCILLHKSLEDFYNGKFHDDSHKVAMLIRNLPQVGNSIPLALFSYGRLESFVLRFQKEHEVELRLLAYGQNYIGHLANRAATTLFVHLQDLQNCDNLPASRVHCEEMAQLVSLSQPSLGKTYKEIILDLTMNPITVGEFKNRVNNILESIQDYGKNIFTWK